MTEKDRRALRKRALDEAEEKAGRDQAELWKDDGKPIIGWTARSRYVRNFGALVCCMAVGMCVMMIPGGMKAGSKPVVVQAAVQDESEGLLGGIVTENPAAESVVYQDVNESDSGEIYGPVFMEYYGPEKSEIAAQLGTDEGEPIGPDIGEPESDAGMQPEANDTVQAEPEVTDPVEPVETTEPDSVSDAEAYENTYGSAEDAEAWLAAQQAVSEPQAAPDQGVALEQAASEPIQAGNDKYAAMSAEWPVAAQVYKRLNNAGWSDVCIAGVLGNMMTECGGQTLNLQPCIDCVEKGVRYYGLCMWSMKYNSDVDGRDVEGQLDYLFGNIESAMAYFGGSPGTYAAWLGSTDVGQAARDFCKYYERGAGYDRRARNAAVAYDWIMKF